MRSHMNFTIKMMINRFGSTVQHKRRIKIDLGDGDFDYQWTVQEPKRGHFNEIMPYDETLTRFGVKSEADFLGTFLPDEDVEEGDLFYFNSNWLEVLNKFEHETGGAVDYIECLLRKQ